MRSTEQAETMSMWVRRVVDESGESVEQTAGRPASVEETVATIMTRTIYCVSPEVGVDTLARLLLEHSLSGLPVVDGDGRPVGVVSKTDLLRHLHNRVDEGNVLTRKEQDEMLAELGAGYHAMSVDGTKVRDIMMPMVFAVNHDASIAHAAALMAGEAIHRLPILDEDGAVCGILSTLDIVRWVAREAGYAL